MANRAFALVEQGRLVEAEQLFARVCEMDGNNGEAWMMRGAIQLELGAAEVAADFLNRAIKLDPNDIEAHFTSCKLFLSQGRLDEAIASGRKAVDLDPDYGEAWLLLSAIYGRTGQFQDAEQSSRRAIALLPEALEAKSNYVNALRSQDKLEEAIPLCEEIRKENPAQAHIWHSLGLAYQERHLLRDAEQCFLKVIELEPLHAGAHFGLGYISKAQGNALQAMLHYKKSKELDPTIQRVHFELGQLLLSNSSEEHQQLLQQLQLDYLYRDTSEASDIAKKLANNFPYDNPSALTNLVRFFAEFDPSRLYSKQWWSNALQQYTPQELAHDTIMRSVFSAVFSWSLPCKEALDEITGFAAGSRIASYGSGAGYWEYLLGAHYGVDIVCHDMKLRHRFIDMKEQLHSDTTIDPLDTIFLAWIPGESDSDLGIEPLLDQLQAGQKLVLIGEPADEMGQPRSCGTRRLFQYLHNNFEHQATIPLANYAYLEDCVEFLTRKR